jgi:excisionase family DNA binding protein
MDSLREWHRYVDRQSRPVRRPGEEPDVSPASWRPWMETRDELGSQPEAAAELPGLDALLGSSPLSEARVVASRRFEDPTLYDELGPIPEYGVPEFAAPAFEIAAPARAFVGAEGSGASEGSDASDRSDGEDSANGADGAVELGSGGSAARRAHYRELLGRVRELAERGSALKTSQRGSRDELVQKLVDPTLTLEETAMLLGVCPTTIRRYTNRGQLQHFRTHGNQRRFRLSDVAAFLEERVAEVEAEAEGGPP